MGPYFYLFLIKLITTVNGLRTNVIEWGLTNSGFHRTLDYNLTFYEDYFLEDNDCEFFVEQIFGPPIFINTDELNDLKRSRAFDIIHPSHVDIEIPTEKAKSFSVLLHGYVAMFINLKLPIHFRYHAPSTERFIRVDINRPKIFVQCEKELDNLEVKREQKYCFYKNQFIESDEDETTCNWISLEHIDNSNIQLTTKIPVGNKQHSSLAVLITITCSWIGCICIILSLHHKMKAINKKLL